MEEGKTDADAEVQAGADRSSAETDRGGGGEREVDAEPGVSYTWVSDGGRNGGGGYSVHPFYAQDDDFANHNRFTSLRSWNLTFTVKRLFGN